MKKFVLCIGLLFIFLYFWYSEAYSTEENRQSQQQAIQARELPQNTQPRRPILPPVVPSAASTVSPTPSPHIAMPPVSVPYQHPNTTIHNVPSFPAQIAVPRIDVSPGIPNMPIIGYTLSEVVDIGHNEDGAQWIKVKDEIFDVPDPLEIKVDPKTTNIRERETPLNFRDIKKGDTVSVVYNKDPETGENTASFIGVLTEEDLKVMEESLKSGLNVIEEGNISPEE